MDDPFPAGLVADWEKYLAGPELPGDCSGDVCDSVFKEPILFPLQRKREMAAMVRMARSVTPRVVLDIGSDKGAGVLTWIKCLSSVERIIASEIRGCPYSQLFEKQFPNIQFLWGLCSSYAPHFVEKVGKWLVERDETPGKAAGNPADKIDVLFIDGDKARFSRDFFNFLPMMRPGGVIFMHDITDPSPGKAYRHCKRVTGFKTAEIIDRSESEEAVAREAAGEPVTSAHESWLRHWRGKSCGVGVFYVPEDYRGNEKFSGSEDA